MWGNVGQKIEPKPNVKSKKNELNLIVTNYQASTNARGKRSTGPRSPNA